MSSWDMRVVTFRALRTLWLSRTKGKPLENIHLFRDLVTTVVNKSPNSYTLRCLICWFLPQRMYEMGGTKLGWIRDNLLKDWRCARSLIVDDWGANLGFSSCDGSNFTGSESEEELEEEEEVIVVVAPGGGHCVHRVPTAGKKKSKRRKVDCDPSCFGISFSPDNDQFLTHVIRQNKFVCVSNLSDLKEYELSS